MIKEDLVVSQERTIDVLQRVLDGFNNHDIDAIMANFAEGCVFEAPRGPDPWGRRFEGKADVRRGLSARFEGIPDVHFGDGTHFATGSRGVSEWTLTGTEVGGDRIEVRGCDLWKMGVTVSSSRRTASGSCASRRSKRTIGRRRGRW